MNASTRDIDLRGVFAALVFLALSVTASVMFGLRVHG